MFGRKGKDSKSALTKRLGVQLDHAFEEMITAISQASDQDNDLAAEVGLFEFLQRLASEIPEPEKLLEMLTQSELERYSFFGRRLSRQVDPLIQRLADVSDDVAMPALKSAFAGALESVFECNFDFQDSRNVDRGIGLEFSLTLASHARKLGNLNKKSEPDFEQFGVLTVVISWAFDQWLLSDERQSALINPYEAFSESDLASKFSSMVMLTHEPIDLLVGLPGTGLDISPNWHELIVNGYLAFQVGALGHAERIYATAQEIYPLPPNRSHEYSYARHIVEGGTPTGQGQELTASSIERLAYLTNGLSTNPNEAARFHTVTDAIADKSLALSENLSGTSAETAIEDLCALAATGGLHPVARLRLAKAFSAVGRNEEAIEHFQILTTVDPKQDKLARQVALGNLAWELWKLRRFSEAKMAAQEALRGDLSDGFGISLLAHHEASINLDFRMRSMLELRVANIQEYFGKTEEAAHIRESINSRGPVFAPYLGP